MTNTLSIITAVHLAALSQIESGDNDRAIGSSGEVTRYQISPAIWQDAMAGQNDRTATNTTDPYLAKIVAFDVWERRAERFAAVRGRNPTPKELYLLWHRPGRVLAPLPVEKERAERFANLYAAILKEGKSK